MTLYDDPRSAWTSYRPAGRVFVAPSSRRGNRAHWAGNPTRLTAASAHSSCLKLVAAWETYHRDTRGWNSIGYNLLICPHARVIEGRGVDYRGAHSGSQDDNELTYGVQFMVGTGELATPAMFARATRLERDLWEHSGRTLFSAGHRDAPGAQTECPGNQIHEWAHSPHTTTEEDDMYTEEDRTREANRYSDLVARQNRILAAIAGIDVTVDPADIAAAIPEALAAAVADELQKRLQA